MVVTWEEALAEREARGKAQGEARGQLKAAQEADLRAARHRFGSLPDEFERAIRSIDDVERLYAILEEILDRPCLDEIDLS